MLELGVEATVLGLRGNKDRAAVLVLWHLGDGVGTR